MSQRSRLRKPNMPKIPVLGPYESQCFSKYFKGVDLLLSKRFSLKFLPDEEHITSILCELLDEHGSQLHSLPYSLVDLNNDLKKNGGLLSADISISTSDYNKHQERHNTQSDLGIILEYQDYIEPKYSFSSGVLIQAKKLFPAKGLKYCFNSEYESFDAAQHDRLETLNKLFLDKGCGTECIKYLMYNPPLEILPDHEQQKILHQQMVIDAGSIFDYSEGLNRYKELIEGNKSSSILSLGCLFASVEEIHDVASAAAKTSRTKQETFKFNLESLVNTININESSLSYFFVFDLMMRGTGCSCNEFLKLVCSGEQPNMVNDLQVAPPKYSIRLKLTAGNG
jgi:hypothetical protein